MIENRLKLNKKPKYELPDEVLVGEYNRRAKDMIPNFEPDLCMNAWGAIRIREKKVTCSQIWIKTDNKDLIDFIRKYNFQHTIKNEVSTKRLDVWKFKKIILEEFYNKNNS